MIDPVGNLDRGHAGGRDFLGLRPDLQAHRPDPGPARRPGAVVAGERGLQPLLEQLVARGLKAVDVVHQRREREPALAVPSLAPVQQGQVRGPRRIGIRLDHLPRRVADRDQRDTRRPGQALLRAGHADIQLPGVHLERHAAQRGHGIHQRHRAVRPRDRANRRAVVQRSRRCLRMDHGHQLNSRVGVEVVSHCSGIDHVVVRDLQLGHIRAQRLEPGAHALAEDPGRQVQHPHPGAYERAGRRLQAEDGLALQQDDFVLRLEQLSDLRLGAPEGLQEDWVVVIRYRAAKRRKRGRGCRRGPCG